MCVSDLPDDVLRLVFLRLDPVNLLRSAAVSRRWCELATSNDVWAPQLRVMPLQKVNLRAVRNRGRTACRDYWCMQHWLRQSLPIRDCRYRSPTWQTQLGIALRAAERGEAQCRQHMGHDTSDSWRLGHGRHMPLLGS